MTPEAQISRNPETRYYLIALAILIICVSGTSATANDQRNYKHEHYSLLYYKNKYSTEIYTYCVKRYHYRPKEFQLKQCLKRQQRSKQIILNVALKQLGNKDDAQRIYAQCMGYYPKLGVTRISKCVKTRLILKSRLEFEVIEEEIYKRCDLKWRAHGPGAIDNCSRAAANTYLDKGILRDY